MSATGGSSSAGNVTIRVSTVYDGRGFQRAEKDIAGIKGAAAGATAAGAALGTNLQQTGKKISSVGTGMSIGLTAPLVLFGKKSFQAAHEFQRSMDRIVSLAGIGRKEVDAMIEPALKMGSEYGKMGEETAQALYFIASSGFNAKDSMVVLRQSMIASATGMGNLKDIADLLTSGINAYGKNNLSASKAVDIMAVAIREGKMEADELAKTMGSLIPIAAELDIPFNDVAGVMAVMSRTGADAFKSATQLRGIMGALLKPSAQGAEALANVGLSAGKVRDVISKQGLYAGLTLLRQSLGDNKEALAKVFPNVRGLAGFLNVMGSQAKVAGTILNQTANAAGEGAKAFEAYKKTRQFQYEQAIASLHNAMIDFGIAATPVITNIASAVAGLLKMFGNLPGPVKEVVAIIGVLTAVTGPLLYIVGTLTSGIGLLTGAYARLTGMMGLNNKAAQLWRAEQAANVGTAAATSAGLTRVGTSAATSATMMGRLGLAGRGLMGFFGGPWGIAITAATIGLTIFGDDLLRLINSGKSAAESMRSMKDAINNSNNAYEQIQPSIEDYISNLKTLRAEVKNYQNAVDNNKKPKMNIDDIQKSANLTNEQFNNSTKSALTYTEQLTKAKEEANNLVETQVALIRQLNIMNNKGSGTKGLAQGVGSQLKDIEDGIKNNTLTSVSQLQRKLQGLKITPEIRKDIYSTLIPGFSVLGRNLNNFRRDLGNVKLPDNIAQQAGQALAELPNQLESKVTAAFARLKPATVSKISNLLNTVAQTGKRKDLLSIAAEINTKKIDGGLKQMQSKVKALKLPKKNTELIIKPKAKEAQQTMKNLSKPQKTNITIGKFFADAERAQDVLKDVTKDETKNITVDVSWVGKFEKTVTVWESRKPKRASGGPVTADDKTMSIKSANRGYKTNRPMFMVGEENRTEYVIATNPAYRKNNIQYWADAGRALGIPGFKTGGKNGKEKNPKTKKEKALYRNIATDGKVRNLETMLARAELTDTTTDDIKAVKKLKSLYTNSYHYLDRVLGFYGTQNRSYWKNKDWKDAFGKKWREKKKEYQDQRLDDLRSAKQYSDQLKDLQSAGGTTSEMFNTFNQEKMDLLSNFSSNVVGYNTSLGMPTMAASSVRSSAGGSGSGTASTTPASSTKTDVNITQNYTEPPKDPHAWTRELQNEITAII